jgi:hypothetical protein
VKPISAFNRLWDGGIQRSAIMGLFSVMIAFTISGCKNQTKQAHPHHVLIAYPEYWTDGDRKPCFLGPAGGYTVSQVIGQPDLPQLDCDRYVKGQLIHLTPADRIYALDVVFTTDFEKAVESRQGRVNDETQWTCQRKAELISCAP